MKRTDHIRIHNNLIIQVAIKVRILYIMYWCLNHFVNYLLPFVAFSPWCFSPQDGSNLSSQIIRRYHTCLKAYHRKHTFFLQHDVGSVKKMGGNEMDIHRISGGNKIDTDRISGRNEMNIGRI
ncbi:hypothetical protein ACJX0J_026704, partial [Zea mays]